MRESHQWYVQGSTAEFARFQEDTCSVCRRSCPLPPTVLIQLNCGTSLPLHDASGIG